MRRPGALRLLASGTLLVGAVVMASSTAWGDGSGATLDTAAWWYKPSQKGVTAPAPPTVPDGGLLVQGQPDGASAIAALRFNLGKDAGSPVLTLAVHDEKDSPDAAPVLAACLAGSAWSGSGEQQWESAPQADCSASVQGILSDDKKSYIFALTPLLQGTSLDVVLVPGTLSGRPDGLAGSTFSIAFEKPTDASLATSAGFSSSSSDFAPPPLPDLGSSDAGVGLDTALSLNPPPAAFTPSLAPSQQGRSATAPSNRLATQANVLAANHPLQDRRGVAAMVLLLASCAAFFVNREPLPAPRRLGPLAGRAIEGEAVAVVETGGLGRFAKPRVGSAPRL